MLTLAQVHLTDDGVREGGHLLFACGDGRLMHVQRRVGSIMAHAGDAVHGVTRLVSGVQASGAGWRLKDSVITAPRVCTCSPLHLDMRPTLFHPPLFHLTRSLCRLPGMAFSDTRAPPPPLPHNA